ncbi:hypothetical protein OBBRIDRAFT_808851, partial [Obba rivulosa]
VLNACPACCYELEDEPPLWFSRMVCIDGNNSLKCMAKVGDCSVGDTRVFSESDSFLSEKFINQYVHEVKTRKRNVEAGDDSSTGSPPEAVEDAGDDEGDPTNLAPGHPECVKYPLAIVAKALELISGASLLGYNIGCNFEETIKQSSLRPLWHARGWRCCGMGLEDLETLERVFSSSNQLAFMAYEIIRTESQAVEEALDSLGIREEDLEKWYTEEEYFATLGEEPP